MKTASAAIITQCMESWAWFPAVRRAERCGHAWVSRAARRRSCCCDPFQGRLQSRGQSGGRGGDLIPSSTNPLVSPSQGDGWRQRLLPGSSLSNRQNPKVGWPGFWILCRIWAGKADLWAAGAVQSLHTLPFCRFPCSHLSQHRSGPAPVTAGRVVVLFTNPLALVFQKNTRPPPCGGGCVTQRT